MNPSDTHLSISIALRRNQFNLEVEFSVGREVFVLFGPSGSGKTSILHAIAGLLDPDEGRISMGECTWFERTADGTLIQNRPIPERKVGMVFQERALFPHMTVLENVNYGVEDRAKARHWLKQVRLTNRNDHYPSELSGGQKQRVAVARAMAQDPELLLLDEPFASLDYRLSRELQQMIQRFHRNRAVPVIYVTHDQTNALRMGSRLAILKNGTFVDVVQREELQNGTVTDQIEEVFGPVPQTV